MKKIALSITIEEGLRALDTSLVITVAQNAMISARQSEIEKTVVREFDALGTALPGAIARNTMIQPLQGSVIDLFVLLKPERGQMNTPEELMRHLQEALVTQYPDAVIAADGRSIIVAYTEFIFHVVPSFYRKNKGYIVADAKKQQWIKTNPTIHYYALDDENHKQRGLLLPVVRMTRYWNECNGSLFNNYYLELLIKETLSEIKVTSYVQAIKYFYKKAIRMVVFTIDDPADNGKQMDGLKDINKMLEAMQVFRDCHEHIVKAEKYEEEGNLVLAYKEFGKIFGGYFHSYVDMMSRKLDANGITGVEALRILRDAT
ncbi:MAG: hypothetical protein OEY06_12135 [Gammaproteobacteria bacterium]|nr:hypothetical protein [Gammaproteobacteria bacterium]